MLAEQSSRENMATPEQMHCDIWLVLYAQRFLSGMHLMISSRNCTLQQSSVNCRDQCVHRECHMHNVVSCISVAADNMAYECRPPVLAQKIRKLRII